MPIPSFSIYKYTGANAGTENACPNKMPCFVCVDQHTTDVESYPIARVQTEGLYNYSYENVIRLKLDFAGNYVQNVSVYGSPTQPDVSSNPANKVVILWGRTKTPTTPTDEASSIATTSQHDNYYSAGTALSLTDAGSHLETGDYTDYYLYQQARVAYGAQARILDMTFHINFEVVP